jgi:hypothetical protein
MYTGARTRSHPNADAKVSRTQDTALENAAAIAALGSMNSCASLTIGGPTVSIDAGSLGEPHRALETLQKSRKKSRIACRKAS